MERYTFLGYYVESFYRYSFAWKELSTEGNTKNHTSEIKLLFKNILLHNGRQQNVWDSKRQNGEMAKAKMSVLKY
jgi:hypothetical protein